MYLIKKMNKTKLIGLAIAMAFLAVTLIASPAMAEDGEYNLRMMATGDLHQYLVPYDYMNDEPFDAYGFSKTYTLIEEAREEFGENTLLFDTGDAIQGSMIGNYEALVEPLGMFETQTIIEAMNYADYDTAAIGNHELQDFGLDFFNKALKGSDFPWLGANFYTAEGDYYTQPFEIINKDINGETVRIGVISFVPHESMAWGRTYLHGEVILEDILESADHYIPMLESITDLVVVASHTGIGGAERDHAESYAAGYHIAQMEEVDAYFGAHSHSRFPSEQYEGIEGIDLEESTIFGTPATKPGRWGEALSIIDMNIAQQDGDWEVVDFNVDVRDIDADTPEHPEIVDIASDVHEATVEYVRTPIGSTEVPIKAYFSEVKDSAVTQVVNEAQMWFAEKQLANTEYEDHPIVGVAAPFSTSTSVEDDITIGDVTDIYLYDNTVYILEMTGEGLVEFLEHSVLHFDQIDPNDPDPQVIETLGPSFNYDVVEGIDYEIDITQPEGERITNVEYNGEPLDMDQEFAMITNDYRAGGGGDFPHTGDYAEVIFSSADANRDQIIHYVEEYGTINPEPSGNWRLKPVDTEGPVQFRTHSDAIEYVEEFDRLEGIEFIEETEDGALFELDLENLGWN